MPSRKSSKSINSDPTSSRSAYQYALRLLNARDYTVKRLHEKLIAKEYEAAACKIALEQLQNEGWLNDLRYAERFAESAVSSGRYFGQRLRMEMKRRGFTAEVVDTLLEQVRQHGNEEQEIRTVLHRRYAGFSYGYATEKEKNRIIGYLQRKGFGLSAIFTVMKSEITDRG